MLELDSNLPVPELGYWINLLQCPQTGLFSQATYLTLHLKALLVSWFDGYTNSYRLICSFCSMVSEVVAGPAPKMG